MSGSKLMRGDIPLTPSYEAIESFDVLLERQEVIFSARRDSNFDIGLAAIDGSEVKWIPEDPADEVAARWAPRGHKVAYIVRNRGGDLIRTVHIPTAFQLVVDFPFGVVHGFAWDEAGERLAVAWESPDASPRIEVLRYGGEERRIAVAPQANLGVTMTPFAGGLMLRPGSAVYNERVPLVIWRTDGLLNEWHEGRAELVRSGRVALLVLDRNIDDAVGEAVASTPWIDSERLFLVDPSGENALPGATVVRADSSVPMGFYRSLPRGIAVHPGGVESAAVGFLREQVTGGQTRLR